MPHLSVSAVQLCALKRRIIEERPNSVDARFICRAARNSLRRPDLVSKPPTGYHSVQEWLDCLKTYPCEDIADISSEEFAANVGPSGISFETAALKEGRMAVESGFTGVGGATLFGQEELRALDIRLTADRFVPRQDPVPTVVGISGDICRQLGVPEWVCAIGQGALNNWLGGDDLRPPPGGDEGFVARGCPSGFEPCIFDKSQCCEVGSTVEQILPGGETGRMPSGQVVMGDLGAAVLPRTVGQINGNPILRCPRGSVLSRKNLCYDKRVLPVRFRKWPPGPKPPMSAKDAKMLNRMGTIQEKVKKLAGTAGFTCKKKGTGQRKAAPAPPPTPVVVHHDGHH